MKAWAIIVGINVYAGASQRPLRGAVADAEDFADWALTTGGVDAANLYFWTHPAGAFPSPALAAYLAAPTRWKPSAALQLAGVSAGPDASRAPSSDEVTETGLQIARDAAAERLTDPLPQTKRCYVFFAGHGLQTNSTNNLRDPQTCFMLGDFLYSNLSVSGMIPCEDFRCALLAAGFDEVVMFLDCCRTPDPQRLRAAVTLRSPPYSMPPQPVWAQGEAAQMGKPAYETTQPPIRGAFSKALLQGLRSVRDPSGALSFDALKEFVCTNISLHTSQAQRPGFDGRPNNPYPTILPAPAAPIVVVPPTAHAVVAASEAFIRVNFGALRAGTPVRLIDAEANLIDTLFAAPAPVEIKARTGALYALDIVTLGVSKGFAHPGPEATDVQLP